MIRLGMSWVGLELDRRLYYDCNVVQLPSNYYSSKENAIGNSCFQGDRNHIFFPYKRGQSTGFAHRAQFNSGIQSQLVSTEWFFRLITNRFPIFLGQWPFENALRPILYLVVAYLVNWRICRNGIPSDSVERMKQRLELSCTYRSSKSVLVLKSRAISVACAICRSIVMIVVNGILVSKIVSLLLLRAVVRKQRKLERGWKRLVVCSTKCHCERMEDSGILFLSTKIDQKSLRSKLINPCSICFMLRFFRL